MPIQYPHQNQMGFRDPSQRNLAYKNVTLRTSDDINIRGWFMTPDPTKVPNIEEVPTIVFFHENAGNIGLRLNYYEIVINHLNVNVLSMAYRGYSYSDNVDPTEDGLKLDAEAIIAFLRNPEKVDPEIAKHINKKLIFAQGRSLGGAVASYVCQQAPDLFRGLMLENTFTSISEMVDHLYPFITPFKKYLLKIGWNNDKMVADLKLPIFFVAGD